MGWFSNPDCPRCGRETTVEATWDGYQYTCNPCRQELAQEKKDKESLLRRIDKLEKALKDKQ